MFEHRPQIDGQTERVNRDLEDLLRLCILDFGGMSIFRLLSSPTTTVISLV